MQHSPSPSGTGGVMNGDSSNAAESRLGPRPVMSLRNVGVYYSRDDAMFSREKFWALQDVSFDLYQGETLGVIGRNGAGKSTLLKLLAGIFVADRGEVVRTELKASLLSLQVGFIGYLTGRENAILSGILLGMHRSEIEAKMDQIIEFSELGEFIDKPVRTYSSGMRARLGFGVAFQADPDILLIDEALGVGDQDFRRKSSAMMKERIQSNKTVVLVSHNLPTIRALCDRVVWIEQGKTVEVGDTKAILRRYRLTHGRGYGSEQKKRRSTRKKINKNTAGNDVPA